MLRRLVLVPFALLLVVEVRCAPARAAMAATLPASLTNTEFWALTGRFSEPNGYFVSRSGSPDNLLSNENQLSAVAASLASRVKPGGVYLGVGPEQNFTYIAAMKPRIAFITDIRRGNLNLQLVYKAIFETTDNRADFVARLFSRQRPARLAVTASAGELMAAYLQAAPVDEATFKANLQGIVTHLTKTHGFALSADDLTGVEYVCRNFYRFGPAIDCTSSINGASGSFRSYSNILSVTDRDGIERSYLANEANFRIVKTMESSNLIVPIVGDFAGPKALRSLGAWLKEHGATVTAFYVSNVEMYLQRNGVWNAFCANAAALPTDAASIFIRPGSRQPFSGIAEETAACAR